MATVHVYPHNDAIAHELDEDCVCGPLTETVVDDDDRVAGFVVLHASLDRRERQEPDIRTERTA